MVLIRGGEVRSGKHCSQYARNGPIAPAYMPLSGTGNKVRTNQPVVPLMKQVHTRSQSDSKMYIGKDSVGSRPIHVAALTTEPG